MSETLLTAVLGMTREHRQCGRNLRVPTLRGVLISERSLWRGVAQSAHDLGQGGAGQSCEDGPAVRASRAT